jgi:hypothetical protein
VKSPAGRGWWWTGWRGGGQSAGQRERPDHSAHRGDPRAWAQRGRLHGGGGASRHLVRRTWPGRSRAGAGNEQDPNDAPDHPAAGDARDHPADRQRDHLHAQDLIPGERDHRHRAALRGPAHLLSDLPDDPASDRGQHLVPHRDLGAHGRPVLHRAVLRPWLSPSAASHAVAAAPSLPVHLPRPPPAPPAQLPSGERR